MNDGVVEEMRGVAEAILPEGIPAHTLRPEVLRMLEIFEMYSGPHRERNEELAAGESRTDKGLAVSPSMAAMCVEDYARTVVFLRGVYRAVLEAREQQKLGPVGVLYAWCGPFVTLALLLMALLSPAECQFVFLEIHGKASEEAKRLVAGLWFEGAVADFVLGDVLNYEIFRSWVPDVIISETMLACLNTESQVVIFRYPYQ